MSGEKTLKQSGRKIGVDQPQARRALKDFHIFLPGRGPDDSFDIKIKEGDDLSNIPEQFIQNLITEGVI